MAGLWCVLQGRTRHRQSPSEFLEAAVAESVLTAARQTETEQTLELSANARCDRCNLDSRRSRPSKHFHATGVSQQTRRVSPIASLESETCANPLSPSRQKH